MDHQIAATFSHPQVTARQVVRSAATRTPPSTKAPDWKAKRIRRARDALRLAAQGLRALRIVSECLPPLPSEKSTAMYEWAVRGLRTAMKYDDILMGVETDRGAEKGSKSP